LKLISAVPSKLKFLCQSSAVCLQVLGRTTPHDPKYERGADPSHQENRGNNPKIVKQKLKTKPKQQIPGWHAYARLRKSDTVF